jgi:hypothetical protein
MVVMAGFVLWVKDRAGVSLLRPIHTHTVG